jgi:hypothetical protein
MTTADYVEVYADNPADAELMVAEMYADGEIRPEHPSFLCEEADLIEEDKNA